MTRKGLIRRKTKPLANQPIRHTLFNGKSTLFNAKAIFIEKKAVILFIQKM